MPRPTSFQPRSALLLIALLAHALPSSAQSQSQTTFEHGWRIGTPATITGELTSIVADDFAKHRSEVIHYVRDSRTGRSLRVHFEGQARAVGSGRVVTLSGRSTESELYVLASSTDSGAPLSEVTPSEPTVNALASGDRQALVVMANFGDKSVSCTADTVHDTMFAAADGLSVAELYRDSSRGALSVSGSVVGPVILDANSTDACDLTGWGHNAEALVAASGIDVSSYDHLVYVLPPNSCPAAGYGTLGGSPGRTWILSCSHGVFAHELGHNLGMEHASTLTSEYADTTDPMGIASWQLRGLNAPHRQQLGWLAGSSIQTVTESGYYDVAPLSMDPSISPSPQVLTIRKSDTGESYYLSYRIAQGFDNYISGWYLGRLSVHRYVGGGGSARTYLLAGLTDSESFVDAANGIRVTHLSHDAASARVRIDLDNPCTTSSPTLTFTPQTQSGDASRSATYSVSLTNNDTAACPPGRFTFEAVVPTGWSGELSASELSLAPNASGMSALTVTPAPGAAVGTYEATVHVNASLQNGRSASGTVAYSVLSDTTPPSSPGTLSAVAQPKLKRVQLAWGAASDNTGVAGYVIERDGAAVAMTGATTWTDTTWVAGATFNYSVVAYDESGNRSNPGNVVSLTLPGGGGGKKR